MRDDGGHAVFQYYQRMPRVSSRTRLVLPLTHCIALRLQSSSLYNPAGELENIFAVKGIPSGNTVDLLSSTGYPLSFIPPVG